MTPDVERKILGNAVIFLRRAQLSGEEVIAYQEVMQYLGARMNVCDTAIRAMGLPSESPPAEDPPTEE